MEIIKSIKEIKSVLRNKQKSKTIGFVPTMGYLHEGHLSLIDYSKKDNDITVLSIFVNPTQFAPNEDLDTYPRDLERDFSLAKERGVDYIFLPSNEEMYNSSKTVVHVNDLTSNLCGASRPTHFDGVTTVVAKLFHIIRPDQSYFGQKDAQQAAVITKMVRDLDMDVVVNVCPIVREEDGLAKSSRNVNLNQKQRSEACYLYKSLLLAKELLVLTKDTEAIKQEVISYIMQHTDSKIDYVEIVDFDNLEEIKVINKKSIILLAVYFGTTRLIDNMILEV